MVSHILGLFNKTIFFLDKGIIPIYVFDGKPPKIKEKIIFDFVTPYHPAWRDNIQRTKIS